MKRAGQAAALAAPAACIALAWACLPALSLTPPSQTIPIPAASCGDGIIEPGPDGAVGEECDPGGGTAQGCSASCTVTCTTDAGSWPIDPRTNHCYLQLYDTRDIVTAGSDCALYGGHVVRFVDQQELAFVAAGAETSPFWVGLRETSGASSQWAPSPDLQSSEPGWADTCAGCFAYVDDAGTIPAGGGVLDKGECVVSPAVLSTGTWTQSICQVATDAGAFGRFTICEREPPGTRTAACGDGRACFTVAATSKRYLLGSAPVSAASAAAFCESLGAGVRLVVFDSPEEREQVGYEISRQAVVGPDTSPARDFWIGLTSDGGAWGWEPRLASAGARAYVIVEDDTVSSGLASAASPSDVHYALCQN